jgi:hypothetical protein
VNSSVFVLGPDPDAFDDVLSESGAIMCDVNHAARAQTLCRIMSVSLLVRHSE